MIKPESLPRIWLNVVPNVAMVAKEDSHQLLSISGRERVSLLEDFMVTNNTARTIHLPHAPITPPVISTQLAQVIMIPHLARESVPMDQITALVRLTVLVILLAERGR